MKQQKKTFKKISIDLATYQKIKALSEILGKSKTATLKQIVEPLHKACEDMKLKKGNLKTITTVLFDVVFHWDISECASATILKIFEDGVRK